MNGLMLELAAGFSAIVIFTYLSWWLCEAFSRMRLPLWLEGALAIIGFVLLIAFIALAIGALIVANLEVMGGKHDGL